MQASKSATHLSLSASIESGANEPHKVANYDTTFNIEIISQKINIKMDKML